MRASLPVTGWVGRGVVVCVAIVAAAPVMAASVLFPQALHLVRRVDDPLARGAVTIHEYCSGNRVVTVNGDRVAIADYDKQQITEIDRRAATYSITRFEEIAKAGAALRRTTAPSTVTSNARAVAERQPLQLRALGVKSYEQGRALEAFEFAREDAGSRRRMEIGVDRGVALSRDALEVLVGAAYPNVAREEHEALIRASAANPTATDSDSGSGAATPQRNYGLLAMQSTTWELEGERLTTTNAVVSVAYEPLPDELLTIPPGAQLVESRLTRLARELRELDRIPNVPPAKP